MNQTIISGNLTADIETRNLNDKTLASFTVADNGSQEKPVFLPVEAWNMDHLPRYLKKGSKVLIQGHLKTNQWKTKQGDSRSRLVLAAHRVEFMDSPKKESATAF